MLQDFPFNAQIGIIAHEFEHIKEYLKNNGLELFFTGAAYVCSNKYKAKYERQTEMNTIKKGFGWQVIAFSKFLFTRTDVPTDYLEYKRSFYFSPSDLSGIIQEEIKY